MVTAKQLSFAGGEISPSLYGRVDTSKYQTGLRTMRNFLAMRHGGAANRPGLQFITEAKFSTKLGGGPQPNGGPAIKLVPFIFSPTQTYILEFGEEYIRFIRDGAQINVSGVAAWAPGTAYVVGDLVVDASINYYCVLAHTSSVLNQPPNPTFWSPLIGTIFEIPSPYLASELPELQFVQSADVMTLVHPNHDPRELARFTDTNWILTTIVFEPEIDPPTNPAVAGSAGSDSFTYHITSIADETFEESLAVTITQGSLTDPTVDDPHTITWTAEPNAQEFNIYLEVNEVPSFIGIARGTSFLNDGIDPDPIDTPPLTRDPFTGVNNRPSVVTYYQQRIMYANSNTDTEKIFGSRTGQFHNFTTSSPLQDDDAVTFTIQGREIQEIRHMIELATLVIFTVSGEWTIKGDEAGILKPVDVNPKQHSYNGSGLLPPLIVGANALYLQARGSVVRDLGFDLQIDGYRGNDLTIFAAHLFDQFTMVDWTYQQIPHSVVWVVRSDGTLLGLTYVREHELLAWHRHDTDGLFENVAVVPEGNEDFLYVVILRTVDGAERRYIERLSTRQVNEETIEKSTFMDSFLTFDGTNTTATTMTISGGPPFTFTDTLIITASTSFFVSGDVGNAIHLTGADGEVIRFSLDAFTSTTVMTGKPHKTVPTSLQNIAVTTFCKAVDEFAGLEHLEGKDVSIFADGFVIANPNNEAYVTRTVSNSQVSISDPKCVVHIGLPYLSDLETLDLDTVQGETLIDKNKQITGITIAVETSRGIWAGPKPPDDDTVDPIERLREFKLRSDELLDEPTRLQTGPVDVNIQGEWNDNGRVFIRQLDPVPLAVLSIAPSGLIPYR